MGVRVVELDGQWQLAGVGPDGAAEVSVSAEVPGHVHPALISAGKLPDPFWRDNANDCQWVEEWDWTYSRDFRVDESIGDWPVVEFDGLDTYAEIELNGVSVGRSANMHVAQAFAVDGIVRPGDNHLVVRFPALRRMLEGKRPDYPAAFTSERVHVRRMQCTFHWDWVNRFVSYGIWRPARLALYDRARLTDLSVRTCALKPASAEIEALVECERRTHEALAARIVVTDPGGSVVHDTIAPVEAGQTPIKVGVREPELWWPNGLGEQPLYAVEATLLDGSGVELDRRRSTFGIRAVEIEELPDAPGSPEAERTRRLRESSADEARDGDAPGRGFTVVVNGTRVFCKGGNWVPADPWPSRVTDEKYDHLVRLARDGGMNCFRVWGGGIYEPEAFWDACDRYGILICQDFLMGCAQYPEDDEEFMAHMRIEAPAAVRRLRNHPSLAWWCGDNENGMHADQDSPTTWGKRIADEITGPAVRDLDPTRPFYPTSPYGGRPNTSATIGDCHLTSLPMSQAALADVSDYRARIGRTVGRFHSECGTLGAPTLRSLRRFMSEEDLADPNSEQWYFHTKDNPYLDVRLYDIQRFLSEKLFGAADAVEERVARLEYVQYEWVRHTVEALRRARPYCAGVLFWMYNDCWPATGWSFVDYYGVPKAAWYAMKRACRPVIASIEDAGDRYRFWLCSDLRSDVEAECRLSVRPWTGAPRWERVVSVHVPAGAAVCAAEIAKGDIEGLGADAVLVCDVATSDASDRAWLYTGMPFEMAPPPTALTVTQEAAATGGRVTVRSDTYARVVTLDGDAVFTDNYFDLLPAEERVVEWTPVPGLAPPETVAVTCWNACGRKD